MTLHCPAMVRGAQVQRVHLRVKRIEKSTMRARVVRAAFLISQGAVKVRGEDGVLRPMLAPLLIARKLRKAGTCKFTCTLAAMIRNTTKDGNTPFISIRQYNALLKVTTT